MAALDRADSPAIGREVAPGVTTALIDAALAAAPVYIDFTTPEATQAIAQAARGRRTAAVIGTTGLTADAEAALAALAAVAPVVVAANYSVGVNLMLGLVAQAARALGPDWDAEIVEMHHRGKRDAPSGTALAIARAIAAARGQDLAGVGRYARDGDVGARPPGEIGAVAVRGGDVVGEHTAVLLRRRRAGRGRTARPIAASSPTARCAPPPGSSAAAGPLRHARRPGHAMTLGAPAGAGGGDRGRGRVWT